MPNNANTDHESEHPLDCEDWRIAFQPYSTFPDLAFVLAQHLHGVTKLIEQGRLGTADALTALDRAIDALMPHTRFADTHFREIARKFYLRAVAGKLSAEQEDELHRIGLLGKELPNGPR
jgi:hypothetical protein